MQINLNKVRIGKYLKENAFASLLSGSIVAQAVTLISMPLITRLYGPTQFGLVSIFINFITIPSALAILKLEGALLIYKNLSDSKPIWLIFILSMLIISMLTILAFFGLHYYAKFGIDKLPLWACIFAVLIVFASGSSIIAKSILVREREYHIFAKIRVLRNLLNVAVRIVGGFFGGGLFSLILAEFICLLSYSKQFFKNQIRVNFAKLNEVKWADIIETLNKWKKFLLLESPSIFVDQFSQVLPLLVIAQLLGPASAGLYALAFTITFLPGSHLGSTMGEIFKGQFSYFFRDGDYKNAHFIFKKTFKNCILLSLVFYVPIYLFIPKVIPFVFGHKWEGSGDLVQIIVPWAATSFIVSTLSSVFSIMQTQHLKLIYDFSSLILLSSFMFFFPSKNLPHFATIISAAAILANIIYFFLILKSYNSIKKCVEL